jgi:hypothetical protein
MTAAELLEEARRRQERRAHGEPIATDEHDRPTVVSRHACQFCKGTLGPTDTVCPICSREPLEKSEQADIVKLYLAYSCKVYNLSQPRASKQSPGLPDLWVSRFHDAWWHETKRPVSGRPSTAQSEFELECAAARVPYTRGGLGAARWMLVAVGAARWVGADGGDIEPVREGSSHG